MAIGDNKEFAWALKALRLGQVIIDTASAVMKTLAEYGGTPLGWGMAAL